MNVRELKPVPEQGNLTKKGFLRSLFKVNNRKLENCFNCSLSVTFCFAHVEHLLTCIEGIYITIDNK